MQQRNIFVLFYPGLGGNHLANMLSTDSTFLPRGSIEQYQQAKDKPHVHFSPIKNLTVQQIQQVDIGISHVFCGHWAEYNWCRLNHAIDRIPNRQILIVKIPDKQTAAHQRMVKYTCQLTDYLHEEQRSLYSIDVIQRMFGEHDIFEMDTDLFFQPSVTGFLDFAQDEMAIGLDRTRCQSMHDIWYNRMVVPLANVHID